MPNETGQNGLTKAVSPSNPREREQKNNPMGGCCCDHTVASFGITENQIVFQMDRRHKEAVCSLAIAQPTEKMTISQPMEEKKMTIFLLALRSENVILSFFFLPLNPKKHIVIFFYCLTNT
jgi:hypothetical protein